MPYLTLAEKKLKLQLSPGSVVFYDIRPQNKVRLFWDIQTSTKRPREQKPSFVAVYNRSKLFVVADEYESVGVKEWIEACKQRRLRRFINDTDVKRTTRE